MSSLLGDSGSPAIEIVASGRNGVKSALMDSSPKMWPPSGLVENTNLSRNFAKKDFLGLAANMQLKTPLSTRSIRRLKYHLTIW